MHLLLAQTCIGRFQSMAESTPHEYFSSGISDLFVDIYVLLLALLSKMGSLSAKLK